MYYLSLPGGETLALPSFQGGERPLIPANQFGGPFAAAKAWRANAQRVLSEAKWTDEYVRKIANAWHPGLQVDGAHVENPWGPIKGDLTKGGPGLYLLWEQSKGKTRVKIPDLRDMHTGTPRVFFRRVSAALLITEIDHITEDIVAHREERVWQRLYWAARFHANVCWTEAAAGGEGRKGGRPRKAFSPTVPRQKADERMERVGVASDSLRIRGVARRKWAAQLAQTLGISEPTVRKYLRKVRPDWDAKRKKKANTRFFP